MPRKPLTFLLDEGSGLSSGASSPEPEHPATKRTATAASAAAVLLITFTSTGLLESLGSGHWARSVGPTKV
ncbi:hypothetical protein GCM10010315_55030 [Streptomyces luteosporeus]|uniref:Uncharacterized protein n=1 Tax=Streptomyces luteosporeus TaxID=173856 RepID=A0ABN3U4U9_9ACTN